MDDDDGFWSGRAFSNRVAPLGPQAGAPQPAAPPQSEEEAGKKLCVVCMDAANSHALLPCGHKCICADCSTRLRDGLCPVCRAPFERVAPIYDAHA